MTDQTTPDRHTCHDQKTAAGPAWKCPRCSLPPADQTAPLADRLAHPEAVREQVRRALDFTYAVSLGYESSDQLLATYDASRAPADQTTPLRDRIAEAALTAVEAALGDTLLPAARAEALAGIAAVLPAPVDQAAVLRDAANALAVLGPVDSLVSGPKAWAEAVETLRRMADETATTETQAANETPPPGGYAHRVCRHCWTGIHWTNGQWAHPDEPRGHTPEPPSLPVEPAAGAQQDGADRG
ncbi:hypothetical protein ACFVOB_28210 [Streptomyces rochei]|uniref:hypothetical protein n=1 Tax=Streptomyces rochei TaxID=1928 RepID=UPI0036BA0825